MQCEVFRKVTLKICRLLNASLDPTSKKNIDESFFGTLSLEVSDEAIFSLDLPSDTRLAILNIAILPKSLPTAK